MLGVLMIWIVGSITFSGRDTGVFVPIPLPSDNISGDIARVETDTEVPFISDFGGRVGVFVPIPADNIVEITERVKRLYALQEVEIADTPVAQRQGLSGRSHLPVGHGLLFIFDKEGRHGIWMKDMLFPIDIVWLDGNGREVHQEKEVRPDTYPEVFTPPVPARYVLELNAGTL